MTKFKHSKTAFSGLSIVCGIALLSPVVTKPTLIASIPSLLGNSQQIAFDSGEDRCVTANTSEEKLFPDKMVINVKTQYGAKGDGVTDDTQAINKAIQENVGTNRVLYLPQGIYLVSGRLAWWHQSGKWESQLRLQGQNRTTTIIRLKDNAPGYNNPKNPKAVVYTASGLYVEQPYSGGKDYPAKGEGNEAFANYIEDLTIDTGNNPGAIAIDYLVNNFGAVRNVTLRGQGVVGLDMTRGWFGPGLIKNLVVQGFDTGIRIGNEVNGATLEHITLCNQTTVGLENLGNIVAIRNLWSSNGGSNAPAVSNSGPGLMNIIDGEFRSGATSASAIENNSRLYAKNIKSFGYQSAIQQNNNAVAGDTVNEFSSSPPITLFTSIANPSLPVEEPPNFHDNDLSNWANIEDFGANGNDWGDDTAAIQQAIDSGKSTVYVPSGRFYVTDTLRIRGNVRRIIAMGDSVLSPGGTTFRNANNPVPFFRIEDGAAPDVTIERLNIKNITPDASPGLIGFEHSTSRTLFLKDMGCCSWRANDQKYVFRNTLGAGKLFIENIAGETWQFEHPQDVWARQLNPEGSNDKIFNNGGKLWVLGLKTEGGNVNTVLHTAAGGVSELFGALLYVTGNVPSYETAFINDNSRVALSFGTITYGPDDFQIYIREKQGSQTNELTRNQIPQHGHARTVPLYMGGQ